MSPYRDQFASEKLMRQRQASVPSKTLKKAIDREKRNNSSLNRELKAANLDPKILKTLQVDSKLAIEITRNHALKELNRRE